MKKKNLIIISIIIIVISLTLITTGIYLLATNKKEFIDISSTQKIYNDYINKKISTDEYVKYNLYAAYDQSKLKEEYKSNKKEYLIHTDDLVKDNYDKLSSETKRFYAENIFLSNVTFQRNDKKETNKSASLVNTIIKNVNAKGSTNLNNVILSNKNHFLIWYTTKGKNKISKKKAYEIADQLENTVNKYKELFDKDFSYTLKDKYTGSRYRQQLEILKDNNIDENQIKKSLSVYIFEDETKSSTTLATYYYDYGSALDGIYWINGKDERGVVATPYIVIKPSSLKDEVNQEQVTNHELFHHYQFQVLCGENNCDVTKDNYVKESTANWASALVTDNNKNNYDSFLNDWAGHTLSYTDGLIGSKYIKEVGENLKGYGLFVYLCKYSELVVGANYKIVNSIYDKTSTDQFHYLSENTTLYDLAEIQHQLAIQKLKQDFINKNMISSNNFYLKIHESIRDCSFSTTKCYKGQNMKNSVINKSLEEEINIAAIGQHYYELSYNKDYSYKIQIGKYNKYIVYDIIKFKDGEYTLVDQTSLDDDNYKTIITNNYGDYDSLYFVVSNTSPYAENSYYLSIDKALNNDTADKYVKTSGIFSKGKVATETNTTYDENGAFLLGIDSVYDLGNNFEPIVTGKIKRGTVKIGDKVQILGLNDEIKTAQVIRIEKYRKQEESAVMDEYVGIGLSGVEKNSIKRGQFLAQEDSMIICKKYDAEIELFDEKETSKKLSIKNDNSLMVNFGIVTPDVEVVSYQGIIKLPKGKKTITNGNKLKVTIYLNDFVAMEIGSEFGISAMDDTSIGKGKVTKIY